MPGRFLEKMVAQIPELPESRTLLAVSGGIDSMTMLDLFEASGWDYGIAHCNFQLRGPDSDGDHAFIKTTALSHGKTFHSITFETEEEAAERGISIQMAARDLRYPWLEAVREEHGYDFIATAHHLNDSIETSLINQTRGTGLRGITGIAARQGTLIRPLMSFTRQEIMTYLTEHDLAYREDSSNAKDKYYRNRIRHHVIPVLQSINPSFEKTFEKNLKIWSESTYLVQWACDELAQRYVKKETDRWIIDYRLLEDHPQATSTLLFEWLREQGFHLDQLQQAVLVAGKSSGAMWYSSTHRILADRNAFLVEPLQPPDQEEKVFLMKKVGERVQLSNGHLLSDLLPITRPFQFSSSEQVVELDADKVTFPLRIRHWQTGDVFCPLGLGGRRKKVQDFFSDLKLDRFQKERTWLVTDAGDHIIWIIGYRLDDRYKLDEQSQKILKLEFVMD